MPLLLQAKSWADEPSSLVPLLAEEPLEVQEPAGEPLEQQVATLTKKLAEVEDAANKAASNARERISQAESEARESRRCLNKGRQHCVTKIKELMSVEEHNPGQLGHLTALFATTVKLSDFTMSSEGKVSVKEGCYPFADLTRDTGAVSDLSLIHI